MRCVILIVLAGCPRSDAIYATPDAGADAKRENDLPPSNCTRGAAPPVTWCRERREGYSTGSAAQFSDGSRFVFEWVNTTNTSSGRSESTFGERGIVIERVDTGSFAAHMTTTCSDDGRVELTHGTTWMRKRYDLADRVLSFEWDQDADDTYESRYFYSYDERGNLARQDHDAGIGTPIDSVFAYTYDTRDRMATATVDRGADGTIESTTDHVWDDLDREIEQTTFDRDTETTERWTWTYDGPRLVQIENIGVQPYRWTYQYDARDRWVVLDFFDMQTNMLDARATQTYDDRDRPLAYIEDTGADDSAEQRVWWQYCE